MENNTTPEQFTAPDIDALAPLFPAYEFNHFIAQGGMGAVYRAQQTSLDRPVAIKILPREFDEDETFRASFEAEAKAMAKLNHPNLISIFDFGEVDGMLFLVIEYVNGKSLFHSSHGKTVDPAQAIEIVSAICGGLDHAHDAGILHRDIKPANILLTPEAVPKIGDFGLASPMDSGGSDDEVIYGTPGYTAPEVINRANVDRRSDVFSIGVILHELLTGSLPDEARTPPSRIAGAPLALDTVVARATHPDPAYRFASTGEMADALDKVAVNTTAHTPLNLSTSPQRVAPVQTPVISRKSSVAPLLVSLLTVAALAAGIFFFVKKDGGKPESGPEITQEEKKPDSTPEPKPVSPDVPEQEVTQQPKPTPKKHQESALDALTRLKSNLAAGKRDAFPPQAIAHEDSHFLLVSEAMDWRSAQTFAHAHGAHLAVLPDRVEREKLTRQLGITDAAWIAAGKAAGDAWQWMDGSAWDTNSNPASTTEAHRYALLNSGGGFVASSQDSKHAFLLQWRNDATNPCTMDAQLTRTAASVKDKGIDAATYPVGTHTLNKSHFLLIDKQLSWEDARQFAKSYGARLAVPSGDKEHAWIGKTFTSEERSIWLGGYLLDEKSPWRWITNEAFSSSGWKPGEPSSDAAKNRMLMELETSGDSASWVSSQGTQGEASHILLEWCKAKPTKTSSARFDLDKWLAGVNRKIADRVKPLIEQYEKDREKLINSYVRDMKRAAKKIEVPRGRGGAIRASAYIQRLVDEAMEDVKESGEIPKNIPGRAPRELHKLTKEAREDKTKLEKDHRAALKVQLKFYTDGLLKKAADITKQGFTQQAGSLKKIVADIGDDTDKFISKLGL